MCMLREPFTRSQSPGARSSRKIRAPSARDATGKMRSGARPASRPRRPPPGGSCRRPPEGPSQAGGQPAQVPVVGGGAQAQFQHVPQGRGGPAVVPEFHQGLQGHGHGAGIGVVAIIEQVHPGGQGFDLGAPVDGAETVPGRRRCHRAPSPGPGPRRWRPGRCRACAAPATGRVRGQSWP